MIKFLSDSINNNIFNFSALKKIGLSSFNLFIVEYFATVAILLLGVCMCMWHHFLFRLKCLVVYLLKCLYSKYWLIKTHQKSNCRVSKEIC